MHVCRWAVFPAADKALNVTRLLSLTGLSNKTDHIERGRVLWSRIEVDQAGEMSARLVLCVQIICVCVCVKACAIS